MTLPRRLLLASGLAAPLVARAQTTTTIDFMFPVAVGGPITKIVDGYARVFEQEHTSIKVNPIYAGSYTDTLTKAQTAAKAGQAPAMAVLLSTDAYTLIDDGLIVPIDEAADTKAWLGSFYPAFLRNTQIDGHEWGVPFQRSTIVMFYNQDAFREVGLDPATPPATWAAHAEAAAKLAKKDARWGVEIPATGFTYWLFQALVAQAGGSLANANGTQVSYDTPASRKALAYWLSLQKSGATPPGLVDWGTTPRDFLEGRSAIIWTTTGNLSNIRASAKFAFGVGMLPAGERRGSPTGGGNFYLFKAASPGAARGQPHLHAMDHQPRARGAMGHRYRLRRNQAGCMGDACYESLCHEFPRRRGGAGPIGIRRAGTVHPRQPARDGAAEQRPCKPR